MGPPFGLEGFVKVKSLSGEIDHFFQLKKVTLRKAGKEQSHEIAEIRGRGDAKSLVMRFTGIDSPEEASVLSGSEIIAGRQYAAPLNNDEYYIEDLKGLEVVDENGQTIGRIIDILEGGGGFLAELKLLSGVVRLVPFRREFLGEIDLEKGKTVLLEPWILE